MPLPAPSLRLSRGQRARLRRHTAGWLFALTATVGCIATPGVAQAAALARTSQFRATPDAARSICNKVSASSVSSIVGYTVPAPTTNTLTLVVDKALGLSATLTSCLFSVLPSATNFSPKMVDLDYEVFNKTVTLTTLKTVAEDEQKQLASKEKANNFKVTWSSYSGLGVPAVYYKWTASFHFPTLPSGVTLPKGISTNLAYQGIAALEGTKAYEAAVNNVTLSESKVGELARLALKL